MSSLHRLAPALLIAALFAAGPGGSRAAHGDDLPAARMLADVGQMITPDFLSLASPGVFVKMEGVLYFQASDGIHGRELWRSDGTAEGTWMVADVCPGACHGLSQPWLAAGEGVVYFAGHTEEHGVELWRSDGTAEGTRLVRDIRPGLAGSEPRFLLPAGSVVYFTATDGSDGAQLWVSDGTAEGTGPLTGFSGAGAGQIAPIAQLPTGVLLFMAPGGLWRTDGTLASTWLVAELSLLFSPTPFAQPAHALLGDHLVFVAQGEGSASAPWISDGTAEGTFMLYDPGPSEGAGPRSFVATQDHVYFSAWTSDLVRRLWRTDGTPEGTVVVWSPEITDDFVVTQAVIAGAYLYFGGSSSAGGLSLRAFELATGTVELLRHFPDLGFSAWWNALWTPLCDLLIFPGGDEETGLEPWRSDGTAAGTYPLGDLYDGPGSSQMVFGLWQHLPGVLDDCSGALFFAWEAHEPEIHWTLYRTDGTQAGTVPLLTPDLQTSSASTPPFGVGPARNMPFFPADGGVFFSPLALNVGFELWHSDGTQLGTRRTREIVSEGGWSVLGEVYADSHVAWSGQHLYFTVFDAGSLDVWISDGTEPGTHPLSEVIGSELGEAEPPFFSFKGRAYFTAGGTVWRSDATPEGTEELPLTGLGDHAVSGPTLFLSASDDVSGRELWRIQGGGGAPQLVADLVPGPESSEPAGLSTPVSASPAAPIVYFSAHTPDAGRELWRSDGTEAGTWRVADVRPGPESGLPVLPRVIPGGTPIVALRPDLVFFVADDGVTGEELWVSDGSEAGTALLADLCPGECGSQPRWLTAAGADHLFFVASTPEHGRELWVTDGTEAGTRILEIVSGEVSAMPGHLLWVGDRLLFSAWHPESGVELWSSDGTPEGTALLQDINPGESSSTPLWLTISGGRVFFVATDGIHGFEPWRLHLDSGIFADGFDQGHTGAWASGEALGAGLEVCASGSSSGGCDGSVSNSGAFHARLTVARGCDEDDVTVPDGPLAGDAVVAACRELTAGAVEVTSGAVRFRAGSRIRLGSGFSVASGASFVAEVSPGISGRALVRDESPDGEKDYHVRFYLDSEGLELDGPGDGFEHLVAYDALGNPMLVIGVTFGGVSERRLYVSAFDDLGTEHSTRGACDLPLGSGWQLVEASWSASASAGGDATLLVAGAGPAISVAACLGLAGGVDNSAGQIDAVEWGSPGEVSVGEHGVLLLDTFDSRRIGPIGPL